VRVAAPLEPGVAARLEETVCRLAGERISVRIEEAADIIGGVWIRIGDTVIDGSVRGRLAVLRQHLCAHCQLALSSGDEEPPAAPSQAQ
jgi:F-type H+-transporting ATPase subunit delta